MLYSFAQELTLFYLRALGLDNIDQDNDLIQEVVEECNISHAISDIAHAILQKIREDEKNFTEHAENWRTRIGAYNQIAFYFFEYIYTRYWNFNGNGESVPPRLSENYKVIFQSENALSNTEGESVVPVQRLWSIANVMSQSSNERVLNAFKNKSVEFTKTLDIQTRQYIFVYCYEHGINFDYF
jgi:hypothetical protein